MKSAASDDARIVFQHDKVPHVLAYFGQGSPQQRSVRGICRNQIVDGLRIRQDGFTRAHGLPPRWIRFLILFWRWPAALAPPPYRPANRGWPTQNPESGRNRNRDRRAG